MCEPCYFIYLYATERVNEKDSSGYESPSPETCFWAPVPVPSPLFKMALLYSSGKQWGGLGVIDRSAREACEQAKVTVLGRRGDSASPWSPSLFLDKDSICHGAICSLRVGISMIPGPLPESAFTLVSPLLASQGLTAQICSPVGAGGGV